MNTLQQQQQQAAQRSGPSPTSDARDVPTEARTAAITPATDPKQRSSPVSQRPSGQHGHHGNDHGHAHAHDCLAAPRTTADGVPRPELRREDFAHIRGWGADLDRAQRPAVPMERIPARLDSVPPTQQQELTVEVLHSNERPGLTPVFGTTVPPSGLSGSLRRLAFKYSENDLRHWLILLGADRVNVVEGVLADLAHGRVPNVYAEMGGRAELRHNPAGAARKALVVATALGVGYALWRRSRRRY